MADLPPHESDHYAAMRFAVRHHGAIRWGAAGAIVVLGLYAAWRTQYPDWIVLGAVGAVITYFAVTLALEVVRLIADMLLPR